MKQKIQMECVTTVSQGNVSVSQFLLRLVDQLDKNISVRLMKEHYLELLREHEVNYADTNTGFDHSCMLRYINEEGKKLKVTVTEWKRSYTEVSF